MDSRMVSKDKLQYLARKKELDIVMLEKDYILTVFLHSLKDYEGFYFKGGTAINKILLNHVRLSEDFDFIKKAKSGIQSIQEFEENPLAHMRCGGIKQASKLAKKASEFYKRKNLGNWHYLGLIKDTSIPKCNIPMLKSHDYLLDSAFRYYGGRFVGVNLEKLLE